MTNPALDYTLFSCTQSNRGENIAEDLRGNGVNLVHFLKVASKLFYSSLHAGYFACFFVVAMCLYSKFLTETPECQKAIKVMFGFRSRPTDHRKQFSRILS